MKKKNKLTVWSREWHLYRAYEGETVVFHKLKTTLISIDRFYSLGSRE